MWFQQFCGPGQDQRQRRCGRAERCTTRMWETSSFYNNIESNAYDAQCECGLTHSVHTDAGQSDIQHGHLDTQFTVHETITFLLVTLPNIHRFRKITHRLSNKPYFILLLTTPPHLKYVATLPRNLSSMVCFADINVSEGSVATIICKVRRDL